MRRHRRCSPFATTRGIAARCSSNVEDAQMDWKGQKLAEKLYRWILVVTTVFGFAVGYWQEDFALMMQILAAGLALACVVRAANPRVRRKGTKREETEPN